MQFYLELVTATEVRAVAGNTPHPNLPTLLLQGCRGFNDYFAQGRLCFDTLALYVSAPNWLFLGMNNRTLRGVIVQNDYDYYYKFQHSGVQKIHKESVWATQRLKY